MSDDAAITALARSLVRTGMYVDAAIDTVVRLDNPRAYAAAILSDPELTADGLHFVMIDTAERMEARASLAGIAMDRQIAALRTALGVSDGE